MELRLDLVDGPHDGHLLTLDKLPPHIQLGGQVYARHRWPADDGSRPDATDWHYHALADDQIPGDCAPVSVAVDQAVPGPRARDGAAR